MFNDKRYTSREVADIRREAVDYILSRPGNKMTDLNESDLGMAYIEVLAGIADMLNYYIDYNARETNFMTARQERNIKANLESMNFKVPHILSARGEVTIDASELFSSEYQGHYRLVLPRYATVSTTVGDLINYVTLDELVLTTDKQKANVSVMQGDRKVLKVISERLKQDYKYYIANGDIPIDSVFLDQKGQSWERVEDAFLEIDGGPKYSVHCDADNNIYIMFTFDFQQYLPQDETEELTIYYVTSLGDKGRVGPYSLLYLSEPLMDDYANIYSRGISVYNEQATSGSLSEIDWNLCKAKARRNYVTMDRCITLSDFDAVTLSHPNVILSYTCDWRTRPDLISEPYYIRSYVVTTDGILDSDQVLKEIKERVDSRSYASSYFECVKAELLQFSLKIEISIKSSNPDYRTDVKNNLAKYLYDYYSLGNCKFGQVITPTEVRDLCKLYDTNIKVVNVLDFEGLEPSDIQVPYLTTVDILLVGDYNGAV